MIIDLMIEILFLVIENDFLYKSVYLPEDDNFVLQVYVKINQKVLEDKARNENTTFAAGLEAFQRMENGG